MTDPQQPPLGFQTRAVHVGAGPDPATGARAVPIHQSVSYVFKSHTHAANLFALKELGYIYSRLTNPTVSALQERLASLEGGVGCVATASGHSAMMMLLFALMEPGTNFVASNKLYGGSLNQFRNSFPRGFGWQSRFADLDSIDAFKRSIDDQTRAIVIESLANPGGIVADIEAIARVAEDAGVPLIVDNTLSSPYLCRPLEYGATQVVHSTTKFLCGQGTALGGAVIDGGKFDWKKQSGRFPALNQPEPGYHGLVFSDLGAMALTFHMIAVGLRDLGPSQQAFNAFLTLYGMETLALRMQRHCDNALKVAQFLESHPAVNWVNYAGLDSSPYNKLARKYLKHGAGAVFTFGVKGGMEAGIAVVNGVKLFSHLANVGDTRSLIIHPASTTHSQVAPENLEGAGASPETVRLSIGLEEADDLIRDLDQALSAAHRQPQAAE